MRFAFIDQYDGMLSQNDLCGLIEVTDRGYRAWRRRPINQRQRDDMVILAHIREQYARRVVGWAVSNRLKKDPAIRALEMAVNLHQPPEGDIHHTDSGSQYCSHDYHKLLKRHGFKVSMSGKGNCYDNAMVETFFKTPKAERVWRQPWHTWRQCRLALFQYINGFYNQRRRHSALGYKSPVTNERKAA